MATAIKVVARFRPFNAREQAEERKSSSARERARVTFGNHDNCEVNHHGKKHAFAFDAVCPPGTSQENVYEFAARAVIDDVLLGYNGTLFAYGMWLFLVMCGVMCVKVKLGVGRRIRCLVSRINLV